MSTVWVVKHDYAYEGIEIVSAHSSPGGAERAAREYINSIGWGHLKEQTDESGLPYWHESLSSVSVEALDLHD
jgi:hypothetical protein